MRLVMKELNIISLVNSRMWHRQRGSVGTSARTERAIASDRRMTQLLGGSIKKEGYEH